jgi:hypothetical protein
MDEKLGDISARIELPEKSLKNFSKKRVFHIHQSEMLQNF